MVMGRSVTWKMIEYGLIDELSAARPRSVASSAFEAVSASASHTPSFAHCNAHPML